MSASLESDRHPCYTAFVDSNEQWQDAQMTSETAPGITDSTCSVAGRAATLRNRLSLGLALLPVLAAVFFSMRDPVAPPLTAAVDRPALVFNEYLIHYGDEPVDSVPVLTPTFMYRNAGTETLRIGLLSPSCGCVRPQASVTELAPGETGKLTLPIRTAGEKPGPHEYTVTVNYTDPQPREVTLAVKLNLPENAVLIEPKALFLMGQFTGEEEHAVTITDQRDIPLTVDRVRSSSGLFVPRITKQERTDLASQTMIGIKVSGSLPPGRQRGIIEVITNDPDYPLLQIPIVARSKERPADQDVVVSSESLALAVSLQPDAQKKLAVEFPESWTFSHIDAYPSQLQSAFEEQSSEAAGRKRLQITLSLSSLPHPSIQHGVVSVHLNEGREVISVPVQFVWPIPEG